MSNVTKLFKDLPLCCIFDSGDTTYEKRSTRTAQRFDIDGTYWFKGDDVVQVDKEFLRYLEDELDDLSKLW